MRDQALFDAKIQSEIRIRDLMAKGFSTAAIKKSLVAAHYPFLDELIDRVCNEVLVTQLVRQPEPDPDDDVDLKRSYMQLAIAQARLCVPEDDRPHPKVGAVVVKNGQVLAVAHRGEQAKGEHAEFTALEKKLPTAALAGGTVYATLEPCTTRNHPKIPCACRLIERKIAQVVIGMLDPNPDICGKGYNVLRQANIGIALFDDDLKSEIEELNRVFIRAHTSRK